jgi:hypothetical protein
MTVIFAKSYHVRNADTFRYIYKKKDIKTYFYPEKSRNDDSADSLSTMIPRIELGFIALLESIYSRVQCQHADLLVLQGHF